VAARFQLNGSEAKRRWATVPALNILQILEAAYVIEAQVPRDDLVSIIVDELVKAPPRPGGHWTKRETWKQRRPFSRSLRASRECHERGGNDGAYAASI
jgi:hypothetical protein